MEIDRLDLENMRDTVVSSPSWELIEENMTPNGDMVVRYHNEMTCVDCFIYYEKGMDQEYYLYKIAFKDCMN